MLRASLFCLSILAMLMAPITAHAEQAGGSGLPPPTTKAEWVRAVNLRVKANIKHLYATTRTAGLKPEGRGALTLLVSSDGVVKEVRIAKSSGIPDFDLAVLRATQALPRLPGFSSDMVGPDIKLKLPFATKKKRK